MTYWERTFLMHRIDAIINRKGTGTADELAEKVGISRRNVFYYFEKLREFGADIDFCPHRKSYIYKDDKKPTLPIMSKSNSDKIRGGENIFAFFTGVQNFCTPTNDLCNKLTNHEEQNDAGSFDFSRFGY